MWFCAKGSIMHYIFTDFCGVFVVFNKQLAALWFVEIIKCREMASRQLPSFSLSLWHVALTTHQWGIHSPWQETKIILWNKHRKKRLFYRNVLGIVNRGPLNPCNDLVWPQTAVSIPRPWPTPMPQQAHASVMTLFSTLCQVLHTQRAALMSRIWKAWLDRKWSRTRQNKTRVKEWRWSSGNPVLLLLLQFGSPINKNKTKTGTVLELRPDWQFSHAIPHK